MHRAVPAPASASVTETGPQGPLDMTLPQLLHHWAHYKPSDPALVFCDPNDVTQRTVITFQALYVLGSRCAAMLRSRGVRREDVVLTLLSNSPERAVLEASLLLLGVFCVHTTCKEDDASDIVSLLKHHRASAVVLDPDVQTREWETLRGLCQLYDPYKGVLTAVKLPDLHVMIQARRRRPPNEQDFLYYLAEVCSKVYTVTPAPFPFHPAAVLRTAGDRHGHSKLVVQSHRNMVAFSKIFMPRTDSPRPSYFLNYPFDTVRGHLAVSLCNPVTRILLDERAGTSENLAKSIYQVIRSEKCDTVVLPPSVVHDMAAMFEASNADSPTNSKLFCVGFIGEHVSRDVLTTTLKFSYTVSLSYVTAELLMAAMTIVTEDPQVLGRDGGQLLQPGVMVSVVDNDELPVACPGDRGHLLVRTPLMFMKYLHDPIATESCLNEEGYFWTGDNGQFYDNHLFNINKTGV